MQWLPHLFVLLVSPAAVAATAFYALWRREFFLGTLASAAMLLATAAVATYLFDGYLLAYQLVFTALAGVPAIMGVIAASGWLMRLPRRLAASMKRVGKSGDRA
jgi:hypothetical protein